MRIEITRARVRIAAAVAMSAGLLALWLSDGASIVGAVLCTASAVGLSAQLKPDGEILTALAGSRYAGVLKAGRRDQIAWRAVSLILAGLILGIACVPLGWIGVNSLIAAYAVAGLVLGGGGLFVASLLRPIAIGLFNLFAKREGGSGSR